MVNKYKHKKDGPAMIDPYWKNQRVNYALAEQSWKRLMFGKRYEDVVVKEKKNGR